MELRQLQSLMAVVEYKSFSKAAEKLFISQPTISTHIRMLEEELNSRLIIRTTKSIEVTMHGRELYECAHQIFSLKDNLVQRWAEENKKIIRVGASTIPADYILPEVLPVFRKHEPDIKFYIHQNDSQNIISGLLNGNFSLGMVGMKQQEKMISFVPFYQDEMVMITPKKERFLNINKDSFSLKDIIFNEPIILREQGSGSKKSIETYFEKMNINEEDLQIIARLNDQESIKKLVASGLGISFISEKAVEDSAKEKLLVFKLPNYSTKRNLYFAYRKDYILQEHIVRFIKFVQDFYAIFRD
ncbi:selenium metabolism-associated LysR family transcriptional regulator [Megamonas hypermegale]|uniref:selenium metabolism-associated LysR family transcriptional regulator n=2 Tax=Megamonas hypermegale TaxID=158847 RepID=UPI0019590426|nr:selenium metabolism-associated LysR family transcriptional regulator [Megamonas hypermegale]MBM6761254.1 LysR family transcriptional regulator [Megamonas hypermegale]